MLLTVNLRLSLTIFKVGFLVESAGGFFGLVSNSSSLPLHGYLLLLTPLFSVFGILLLWVGRHEWNSIHHRRVGYAHLAFVLSLVAIALAAAPIAYLIWRGDATQPGWLGLVFGAAVALVFGLTFVTYAAVAAHLVGRLGEAAMGIGLAWAFGVSALIGFSLSPQLDPIVHSIVARSASVASIFDPIRLLDALLGFSYLAFFLAFAEAHYRVAQGANTGRAAEAQGA